MIAKIPILIPVKQQSVRCPGKNYDLLPFTARFIYNAGLEEYAIVITDSRELSQFASKLGLKTYLEVRHQTQDELTSCKNYIEQNTIEYFFLCPVTQPLRDTGLFELFMTKFKHRDKAWDFMTTITKIQDRSIFHLKQQDNRFVFEEESRNRKGNLCNQKYMIDGALYLIKSDFLKTVLGSPDPNHSFWNGDFLCIENEAPFLDIDTKEDMSRFKFFEKYFSLIIKDE
jgi:pseudaminic acid cytidylyltransferase